MDNVRILTLSNASGKAADSARAESRVESGHCEVYGQITRDVRRKV